MRKVRIRNATDRDATEIARVLVRSIREVCGPGYDYDEETLAAWCSNAGEPVAFGVGQAFPMEKQLSD